MMSIRIFDKPTPLVRAMRGVRKVIEARRESGTSKYLKKVWVYDFQVKWASYQRDSFERSDIDQLVLDSPDREVRELFSIQAGESGF
jgi:hypothetical protein